MNGISLSSVFVQVSACFPTFYLFPSASHTSRGSVCLIIKLMRVSGRWQPVWRGCFPPFSTVFAARKPIDHPPPVPRKRCQDKTARLPHAPRWSPWLLETKKIQWDKFLLAWKEWIKASPVVRPRRDAPGCAEDGAAQDAPTARTFTHRKPEMKQRLVRSSSDLWVSRSPPAHFLCGIVKNLNEVFSGSYIFD